MNKKIILSLILLFSLSFVVSAQNVSNVNVGSLSDSQIQKVVAEIESRGLTIDQAVVLAQSRGATPSQIDDLKRRIQDMQKAKGQSVAAPGGESIQSSVVSREAFSEKAANRATPKAKSVYGYNLFNNENLTFEPSVNIPTPKNYVIGIGDELIINIWGASQQTYQLTVNKNGAIQVMDLGPIYISGMSFEKAKSRIKNRLVAIYNGMGTDNPNTWSEVSLSNLRAIKINITGEVIVPGTYNLPSTTTAFNALYLSGGPNENGSFRDIRLIRDGKIIEHIDVYDFLINSDTKGNVQLRDQDILFIPTYHIRAEMSGAFKRNNLFELLENESLSDLIRYAGGFGDGAYQHRLSITRLTAKEKEIIDIEKKDFDAIKIHNGDVVSAGFVIDRFQNRVSISGAVYRPGDFQLTKGLTLLGLIKKAEGVKEEVYANRGHVIREMDNRKTELISFNVDSVLSGKTDFLLKKEDVIQIADIFSMEQEQFVSLIGEVQNPGKFSFHENMTLKDLVFFAGGFNEAASDSYIEISRRHDYETAALETDEMVDIYTMNINRDLQLDVTDESFLIKPFDNIYVRRAPSYYTQQTVRIEGEVIYPGSYSIKSKDERISDLIRRSGGLSHYACIEGATLNRKFKINDIEVEDNLTSVDTTSISIAIREFQSSLVELKLKEIMQNPGSVYDYTLKEGDVIKIPLISEVVTVYGEVSNPIGLSYEKGRNVKYYINKSGGFNSNAKRSGVYVLYANGTTDSKRSFLDANPIIKPGCQIIVPPKPEKIKQDTTGKILSYTTTLASLAIALAAIFR